MGQPDTGDSGKKDRVSGVMSRHREKQDEHAILKKDTKPLHCLVVFIQFHEHQCNITIKSLKTVKAKRNITNQLSMSFGEFPGHTNLRASKDTLLPNVMSKMNC